MSPIKDGPAQIKDALTFQTSPTSIPWNPNCTKFPTRRELPKIEGAPEEAAWVWGEDDFVCVMLD